MTKQKSVSKLRISKQKEEVKGSQSYAEFYKGLEERATGLKRKKSWSIHPSEIQWRNDMGKLNPTQRCILIDLSYYARKKGVCYPSIPTIAKNLNLNSRTISRNLPALRKKLLIKIAYRKGKNNHYKLNLSF